MLFDQGRARCHQLYPERVAQVPQMAAFSDASRWHRGGEFEAGPSPGSVGRVRYSSSRLKPPPLPIASFTYDSKKHRVFVERGKGGFAVFFVLCPRCKKRCQLQATGEDPRCSMGINLVGGSVSLFPPISCSCGWTVVIFRGVAIEVTLWDENGNGHEKEPARGRTTLGTLGGLVVRPQVGFLRDRLVESGSARAATAPPPQPARSARPHHSSPAARISASRREETRGGRF
jgi:hypothetical protein